MDEKNCSVMDISDVLARHPRHPSLIHIKKYNVKERRKLFEKAQESDSAEEKLSEKSPTYHSIHCTSLNKSVISKNKLLNVFEEDEMSVDANSNYIPVTASKPFKTHTALNNERLSNANKNLNFGSSQSYVSKPLAISPPVPVFVSRFGSNLRSENTGKIKKTEKFGYITDQPFKSTLISKVVWTGVSETQEKSDGSESGVFLNDPEGTSDENSVSPSKIAPQLHSPLPRSNHLDNHSSRTSKTQSIYSNTRPVLPPKPPRLLTQVSHTPTEHKVEKSKRSTSSAYEFLSNTHSVNLPVQVFQNSHKNVQRCSTFPIKSPTSSPDDRSPDKMANFLVFQSKEYSSTPQDLFLCKSVGVAEMKDKFERQSMCSETSSGNRSILINKSAENPHSKKNFFKQPKSKKFVTKKDIDNPNYERVRAEDSRTKPQSRVTFKESDEGADGSASGSKFGTRDKKLHKRFSSVHDEDWRNEILEEPTYADPRASDGRFVGRTDVDFDAAGYAIPSQEFPVQFTEDDNDEKSIYMRGFSKEERSYFKSKVSDAYSILRIGNNLSDDVALMTRSVSAGNIPKSGSASEHLDFIEHEKRLNYVSTIRRLTFKNVSKYEQVKSNLNVGLFEYALVVALKPPTSEDDNEIEDDDDFSSDHSKTDTIFSWPESLEESDLMTSNFCFPDASRWRTGSQLSGEMFCFFLTTGTGDRKFCWCLRYQPVGSDLPEAICVVSMIGEAGFYQQLLNSVREARMHSLELAQETLKSAHRLKLPRPNQELYINACDHEGFKYTGVLKRMTESHYSTARFGQLVKSLPISLLIQVVASMLLERRIILLAEQLSTLSSCILSLSTLLYPFTWPHTLITVLPPSLLELVHSPTPYILGMFSSCRNFVHDSSLDEVLVIDLDEGCFVRYVGDESRILPKKIQKALTLALSDVPKENGMRSCGITDVTLTEAYLRMFVEMCGHYKDFISSSAGTGNTFQGEEFVKAVSSSSIRLFLEWFSRTQMFQVFIHDRMKDSFVEDLFDQRIEEYKKEMEGFNNSANKFMRSKFFSFFKSYGSKIKKSLKSTFD